MERVFLRGGAVVLVICLVGCATIIHGGGKQHVTITSSPTGATATIDGMTKLQTPGSVKLKRSKDHVIVVEKEGYEPAQTLIDHEFSPWVFGNIVLGGLIGLAIDFGTGGAYTLEPDSTMLTLTPKLGAVPATTLAPALATPVATSAETPTSNTP